MKINDTGKAETSALWNLGHAAVYLAFFAAIVWAAW